MPTDTLPLIPPPPVLEPLQRAIQAWAVGHAEVHRVFLYGSTLWLKPDPSDLDLAVELRGVPIPELLRFMIDHKRPWAEELSAITGRPVDLQYFTTWFQNVWEYLHADGCALVFERN